MSIRPSPIRRTDVTGESGRGPRSCAGVTLMEHSMRNQPPAADRHTDPDHAAPPSLWRDLRDAIRGTDADYTKIPLRRAVFLLAVPMVLELVLESTFAVVDIFFVAKLGPSAVATVGLTESYMFLLYAVAMGLAMAV